MAAEPVFIDTNVLVYVTRPSVAQHTIAFDSLNRLEMQGAPLWISTQIVREYLAVVTRPQATAPALPMASAIADVRCFLDTFNVADCGSRVLERLLDLLARRHAVGRQVHDANIVATMLEFDIRRLLTFNGTDFRRYAREIDLVPLQ